jgi:predicted O-linked N-acetylglucosamine transferase (SPINDLY family)
MAKSKQDQLLLLAEHYFQNKNFSFAENILKQVLLHEPTNSKANELLAYIYGNQGDIEASFRYLNLACGQKNCTPEALYYLGTIFLNKALFQDAINAFLNSMAKSKEFFEALHDIGTAYAQLGESEKALSYYEKCKKINTNSHELYFNIGRVLDDLHRHDEATIHYDHALKLKPQYAEALLNKGVGLSEQKKFNEAIISYCKALEIKPDYAEAWFNKGNVFKELKRLEDSIGCYENAIKSQVNFAEAWFNKGNALKELKILNDAIFHYKQALFFKPNLDWLFGDLCHLQMRICCWDSFNDNVNKISHEVHHSKKIIEPFALISLIDDPFLHKKCSEIYTNNHYTLNLVAGPPTRKQKKNKLNIAYFSADFRNHPVAFLTAELFELHDKNRFEITAFSFGNNDKSDLRHRLEKAFNQFIDASDMSDLEIVQLAREADIDIAIDLGGYTSQNRAAIFAHQVAPIQISYLGYLGTMGAKYIDYLLADKTIIPNQMQEFFTEKIAYLPSYQVNDRKRPISEKIFSRKELGLPENSFVFCCFNNNYKIIPSIFNSWMRILMSVNGSVLFLFAENDSVKKNLRMEAEIRGIDASRLIFGNFLPPDQYRARFRSCDLFLDTFPYNAGTTASDALWAGLPVLTRIGKSFASRIAASLLTAIELPQLITRSTEEYEELAIDLALNPQKLALIKADLASNRLTTSLFNTPLFTQYLEAIYIKIYERYQMSLKPDHIYIEN